MALQIKISSFFLTFIVSSFLFIELASGCQNMKQICSCAKLASPMEVHCRKVMDGKAVPVHDKRKRGTARKSENRKLRQIPSGPDPLHHKENPNNPLAP